MKRKNGNQSTRDGYELLCTGNGGTEEREEREKSEGRVEDDDDDNDNEVFELPLQPSRIANSRARHCRIGVRDANLI